MQLCKGSMDTEMASYQFTWSSFCYTRYTDTHVTDSTEIGCEIMEVKYEINYILEIWRKSEITLEIRNHLVKS